MKVNRRKTECMCVQVNGMCSENARRRGRESGAFQISELNCTWRVRKEVKKRVQAGWNGWRRMLGVICDRRVPAI